MLKEVPGPGRNQGDKEGILYTFFLYTLITKMGSIALRGGQKWKEGHCNTSSRTKACPCCLPLSGAKSYSTSKESFPDSFSIPPAKLREFAP
jgi:hypothetical protein